jgi:hypothetical protein
VAAPTTNLIFAQGPISASGIPLEHNAETSADVALGGTSADTGGGSGGTDGSGSGNTGGGSGAGNGTSVTQVIVGWGLKVLAAQALMQAVN